MNDGMYNPLEYSDRTFIGLETSIFRSWGTAAYWDTAQTLIYSNIRRICYSLNGCRRPIPNFCAGRDCPARMSIDWKTSHDGKEAQYAMLLFFGRRAGN